MIFFLAGVVVVGLLWYLGKNYAEANPKHLAALLRKIGGWAVIAFAALLALRGRIDLALLVGGAGWWLVQGQRLDAYLNSRFSIGRKNTHGDADPGAVQSPGLGSMSEQEALEILGLQQGATGAQIRDAHRALMKKLHPDQGGTNYLATRVNQAKDVLLNGHR
ncbi:DnaJ domain-containing protein [Pseudochelatococcus sp. G4_1912]|uniref:DnaJ domain-containing protein n=1 Tax=Pseudochelatococcus sp. G4_1912 TaxID=3114288 RepID=UPI0039C5AFD4